jgi:hypothetical protein
MIKLKSTTEGLTLYIFLISIGLCLAAALTSCRGNSENNVPGTESNKTGSVQTEINSDYSGVYRLVGDNSCTLAIDIRKHGQYYSYSFHGAGVKSSGKLAVENDGGQVYLVFTGTLRSGDRSPVTGAYSDNAVTIQNYGNSMSEYVCFKQCEEKYLRLRR